MLTDDSFSIILPHDIFLLAASAGTVFKLKFEEKEKENFTRNSQMVICGDVNFLTRKIEKC
jgi:hypothetical protein